MLKTGKSVRKVTGGKLIRVDASYQPDRVEYVKITGDFFLFPEEVILDLEEQLVNLSLPIDKDGTVERLNEVLQQSGAQLIGVSAEDIVQTLQEAVQ